MVSTSATRNESADHRGADERVGAGDLDFEEVDAADPVEVLFMDRTIPEVRDVLKSTVDDIEDRSTKLRELVGDRYRDILDSSVTISEMHDTSSSLAEGLGSLAAKYAAGLGDAQAGAAASQPAFDPVSEADYQLVRRVAFLADSPEQIWTYLDDGETARAALLTLRSALCSHEVDALEAGARPGARGGSGGAAPSLKVSQFPILDRQRGSLRRFPADVSARCDAVFSDPLAAHHHCASAVAAVAIAQLAQDRVLPAQPEDIAASNGAVGGGGGVVRGTVGAEDVSAVARSTATRFLEVRARAVKSCFENPDADPLAALPSAASLVISTVTLAAEAFGAMGSRPGPGALGALIRTLGDVPAHTGPDELVITRNVDLSIDGSTLATLLTEWCREVADIARAGAAALVEQCDQPSDIARVAAATVARLTDETRISVYLAAWRAVFPAVAGAEESAAPPFDPWGIAMREPCVARAEACIERVVRARVTLEPEFSRGLTVAGSHGAVPRAIEGPEPGTEAAADGGDAGGCVGDAGAAVEAESNVSRWVWADDADAAAAAGAVVQGMSSDHIHAMRAAAITPAAAAVAKALDTRVAQLVDDILEAFPVPLPSAAAGPQQWSARGRYAHGASSPSARARGSGAEGASSASAWPYALVSGAAQVSVATVTSEAGRGDSGGGVVAGAGGKNGKAEGGDSGRAGGDKTAAVGSGPDTLGSSALHATFENAVARTVSELCDALPTGCAGSERSTDPAAADQAAGGTREQQFDAARALFAARVAVAIAPDTPKSQSGRSGSSGSVKPWAPRGALARALTLRTSSAADLGLLAAQAGAASSASSSSSSLSLSSSSSSSSSLRRGVGAYAAAGMHQVQQQLQQLVMQQQRGVGPFGDAKRALGSAARARFAAWGRFAAERTFAPVRAAATERMFYADDRQCVARSWCKTNVPVYDEDTGATVVGEQSVSVPAAPSTIAAAQLAGLAREIAAGVGHVVGDAVVAPAAERAIELWCELASNAVPAAAGEAGEAPSESAEGASAAVRVSERGAVQLEFDLRHAVAMLGGRLPGRSSGERQRGALDARADRAVARVGALCDPIDAAVRAPAVASLLVASLAGSASRLGPLSARYGAGSHWQDARRRLAASASANSAAGKSQPSAEPRVPPSLLDVARVAPRFGLLPVRMDDARAGSLGGPGRGRGAASAPGGRGSTPGTAGAAGIDGRSPRNPVDGGRSGGAQASSAGGSGLMGSFGGFLSAAQKGVRSISALTSESQNV